MSYYPVFIPTLNRYSHFKNCVESLARCIHADKTELVIGLDYPPSEKYVEGYNQIKEYIPTIIGFAKVTLFEQTKNLGPEGNWACLVNYCMSHYDAYIGTEDDNVFAPAFLDYMNRMLNLYYNDDKILTVSGYNFVEAYNQGEYTYYLSKDNCAWGVGLWKHKEAKMEYFFNDRSIFECALFRKANAKKIINAYPALYLMLNDMMNKNASWGDVMRTTVNILYEKYQVKPAISLVRNCGYDGSGIHCGYDDNGLSSQEISDSKSFDMGIGLGPGGTKRNRKALYNHSLPQMKEERKRALENIFYIYRQNIWPNVLLNLIHKYYSLRAKLGIRTRIMNLFLR